MPRLAAAKASSGTPVASDLPGGRFQVVGRLMAYGEDGLHPEQCDLGEAAHADGARITGAESALGACYVSDEAELPMPMGVGKIQGIA